MSFFNDVQRQCNGNDLICQSIYHHEPQHTNGINPCFINPFVVVVVDSNLQTTALPPLASESEHGLFYLFGEIEDKRPGEFRRLGIRRPRPDKQSIPEI
jgi:hypothetical protein